MAIIGGSAITLLAGRIRRRHTIADLESPTAELRATLPDSGFPPGAQALVEAGGNIVITLPLAARQGREEGEADTHGHRMAGKQGGSEGERGQP